MNDLTISHWLIVIIFAIGSYFIGNISPASIIGKIYGVDIRKEGSGNPGTTNVLRTLGVSAAIITLLIDILKGIIPVILAGIYGNELLKYLCATCVFCGHIWPLFYKFKGGKGIATGFGILMAIDYRCGLICLVCALLGALVTRRMSLGSMLAGAAVPITFFIFHKSYILWALGIFIVVLWRHSANIKRLMSGTEPEIGFLSKHKKNISSNDKVRKN